MDLNLGSFWITIFLCFWIIVYIMVAFLSYLFFG